MPLKRITLNTFWQILGKAVTVTLGLLMTMMLTRYLGQEGFGQYSLVIAFVVLFGTFSNWGLSLIAVREASQSRLPTGLVSSAILLRILLSSFSLILLVFISFFLPYSEFLKTAILIGGLLMFALQLKESFYMVFNLKLKMQNWALVEVLTSTTEVVFFALAISRSLHLYAFLYVLLAANLAAGLLSLLLANRLLPGLSFPGRERLFAHWARLGQETLPMGAVLAAFTVYTNLDRFLLSVLPLPETKTLTDSARIAAARESAIGAYSAAYRVQDVLVQPAAFLMNSFLPLMSLAASGNESKGPRESVFSQLFLLALVFMLLMAFPMLIVTLLLAPWIMEVIAPNFTGSATALRILVLATFISYFNHLTGFSLVALRRQRTILYFVLLGFAANLLANFYAIPRWSFFGAAATTVLTEGIILIMTSALVAKLLLPKASFKKTSSLSTPKIGSS